MNQQQNLNQRHQQQQATPPNTAPLPKRNRFSGINRKKYFPPYSTNQNPLFQASLHPSLGSTVTILVVKLNLVAGSTKTFNRFRRRRKFWDSSPP